LLTATKAIAITTLQKALISATIIAAAGTGIYEAHQASQLRDQVQTLQQQQGPLAEQIQQLQKQLESIENGIRNSRNNFNTAVNDYNVKVRSFPMNTLAGVFGFKAKPGFTAEPGSDKAPEVKF